MHVSHNAARNLVRLPYTLRTTILLDPIQNSPFRHPLFQ